jgi:hypothetical protein
MDLRMGSLVRMLALSLRNGCLVLVEGEEVSDFAKVAEIINSCNTEAQLKVAEKVVALFIAKTNRELLHGKISMSKAYERLSDYGALLAYHGDKLVDIIGAPQRWKIGVHV